MWLCLNPTCLQRAAEEPRHVAKAIRNRPPDTRNLPSMVQQYLRSQVAVQLQYAWRSGVIVHGSQRVMNCLNENISAVFFAADAGAEIKARTLKKNSSISNYIIPLSCAEIGTLLRRGPRSVLALRPGRKTQSLIETLRGWDSLG